MSVYYTPELMTSNPPVAPVPAEDHPLLRAAIVGDHRIAQRGDVAPAASEPRATALPEIEVRVEHADPSGYAGQGLEIFATVANLGSQPFEPRAIHPFRVGCRWRDRHGIATPEEGRADLPVALAPGRAESVVVPTRIPAVSGAYTLSVGSVEEGKRWRAQAPEISFRAIDQPQVSLVGGYSPFRHLGDDLITRSLLEDLTDEFPQLRLTLLADDPEKISKRFGVAAHHTAWRIHRANIGRGRSGPDSVDDAKSASRRYTTGDDLENDQVADLTDVISRSGALIVAAAGSLTSAYAEGVLWPRLIEAEIASASGVPVIVTSAGMGPFTNRDHRTAAARLLDIADEVHVRDPLSLRAVSEIAPGGPTAMVFPDAASWLAEASGTEFAAFLDEHDVPRSHPYLVASVRADDDTHTMSGVARSVETAARALDATAVLLPHCASRDVDDRPSLEVLAGLISDEVTLVTLTEIPSDPIAAALVRNARISIGSRFHNAVLSAAAGRPAILFCGTEYDEARGRGLAAMPGSALAVMTGSHEDVTDPIREVLDRRAEGLKRPRPRPIVAAVRALDIMR